jgi:hypothetical protein
VKQGDVSDPYLIGFYDQKTLTLSHEADKTVQFTLEVDPTGNGDWMEYLVCPVKAGEAFSFTFPESFQARWVRFRSDSEAKVTTWLEYK